MKHNIKKFFWQNSHPLSIPCKNFLDYKPQGANKQTKPLITNRSGWIGNSRY